MTMKETESARNVLEKLMERKLGANQNRNEWESDEEEDSLESGDEQSSDGDGEDEVEENERRKTGKGNRHVEELKKVLGLENFNQNNSQAKEETDNIASATILRVETKASQLLGKGRPPAEVVCFKSVDSTDEVSVNTKKKRMKLEERTKDYNGQPAFSMRKARHEVLRFGLTGFDKETQRAANVALAIKLGARPPKNEYKNYKFYKEQQRDVLEQQRQQRELDKRLGKNVKKFQKQRDKKEAGGSMGLKMGRFDGGILKISSKEVERFKKKKKR